MGGGGGGECVCWRRVCEIEGFVWMRVCLCVGAGGMDGGVCKGIDENSETYSIRTILVVLTLPLRFFALINC